MLVTTESYQHKKGDAILMMRQSVRIPCARFVCIYVHRSEPHRAARFAIPGQEWAVIDPLAMRKKRINITVSVEVHSILSSTGNGSAYVDWVIRERWERWHRALMTLEDAGWTSNELIGVLEVLGRHVVLGDRVRVKWMASMLTRECGGIEGRRRTKMADDILSNMNIAHALMICVAESRQNHSAWKDALRNFQGR